MVDIEDELRRVLHEHAGEPGPSTDLAERIERRLRRRVRGPRLVSALAAVAIIGGVTVAAQKELSHTHRTSVHTATGPTGTTSTSGPPATALAAPLHVTPGGWTLTAEPPFSDAFASIWTGDQLIVAFRPGGSIPTSSPATLKFASFDPARNQWQTIADPPIAMTAPLTNSSTFVWTGTAVLVWGYDDTGRGDTSSGHHRLLAYNPTTQRWAQLADPPINSLIQAHPVWTGREMIVWGGAPGSGSPGQGAAYDPARDQWRHIATAPLSTRENPMIVWTGREMIAWGGFTANAEASHALTAADRLEGAAYNPTSDSWRALPPSGLPVLSLAAAAWTGQEMLIDSPPANGAAYNPTTNRWRHLSASPLGPRDGPAWTWTGRRLILWGGLQILGGRQAVSNGAAYDPSTDRWTLLPDAPIGPRHSATMGWTGELAIVIGGYGPSQPGAASEPPAPHAAAYRP
jgi:N-acetylneuraminic acid mutarotase